MASHGSGRWSRTRTDDRQHAGSGRRSRTSHRSCLRCDSSRAGAVGGGAVGGNFQGEVFEGLPPEHDLLATKMLCAKDARLWW